MMYSDESRRPSAGAGRFSWLLILCFVSITSVGADRQDASGDVRLTVPISPASPRLQLPRAQEITLANGLRVVVVESVPTIPTCAVRLVITGAGGLHESPTRRGVGILTAEMLLAGTAHRSAQDIARDLERLGVHLEVDAPLNSATVAFTMTSLTTHAAASLELLSDLVRDPIFPKEQVSAQISRRIGELDVQRARAEVVAQERLLSAVYGAHVANSSLPSGESLRAMTADDLREFHAARYTADAAVLVIVGDVTLRKVLPAVERAFGDWRRADKRRVASLSMPAQPSRAVHVVDRPDSVQTYLLVGALGITRTDPDYAPLTIMNHILGGQSSARLNLNLRQRMGYTYGAYSDFTAAEIPGVWRARAPVRTSVTAGALAELFNEIERVRREPVSDIELAKAKRALIGKYILSLERTEQLLSNVITQVLYGLPASYWESYPRQIEAVTARDVLRVARRVLDPAGLQLVAVGDADEIEQIVAPYAKNPSSR